MRPRTKVALVPLKPLVSVVLSKREFLVYSHCIYQLAVPRTSLVYTSCANYPITNFCQFDYVTPAYHLFLNLQFARVQ
jgi:hypothetical protein